MIKDKIYKSFPNESKKDFLEDDGKPCWEFLQTNIIQSPLIFHRIKEKPLYYYLKEFSSNCKVVINDILKNLMENTIHDEDFNALTEFT